MVRRPAVYELNGEENLAEVLELAGGVLPSGTLRHVDVERVQSHESRSMLRLDIPENNNEPSHSQGPGRLQKYGTRSDQDFPNSPLRGQNCLPRRPRVSSGQIMPLRTE